MDIVVVRHGLSEGNKDRVITGSRNVALSKEGIELLKELKDNLNYPNTDIYVSSDLSRCVDTFNILYNDKTLHKTDNRFRETNFGSIEGRSFDDVDLDLFFNDFYDNKTAGDGESYSDFFNRLEAGLLDILIYLKKNNLKSATIVCHSTVIKTLVGKATGKTALEHRAIKCLNGEGYIFEMEENNNKVKFKSCKEIGKKR